jgi:hypothetical protein
MDVLQPRLPGQKGVCAMDTSLESTPNYGTLGPPSDFASDLFSNAGFSNAGFSNTGSAPSDSRRARGNLRLVHVGAMLAGIGVAVAASSSAGMGAVWARLSGGVSSQKIAGISSNLYSDSDLDRQKPQKQAEMLLERAVTRSDGATDQIEARVDGWRGKLNWDARLGELTTVALNSNDTSVRNSAIEVQLAAYGLSKNRSTVDALVERANSPDHSRKIWAFWSLGLLANRGIETDRVVQVLTDHLRDTERGADRNSEDARRWAVEALALVGTTPTIAPLLDAMHNDPSAMVRERAACSLAESGMLSHNQRLIAVPQLIEYSGDPALDAQTRGWAFQALADITRQRLPNDSAAWRNWYQNSAGNN